MNQTVATLGNKRRTDVTQDESFIRIHEVLTICGISKTSLYDAIKAGKFPTPVKVQGRSSAWIRSEVQQWIQACIAANRAASSARKRASSKVEKQAAIFERRVR